MMGIEYETFWTLNPNTIKPFVKAFELSKEYDDTMLWMQGQYIQLAVASVMDGKNNKYPTKPLTMGDEELDDEAKIQNFKTKMLNVMVRVNRQLREGDNNG